MDELSELNIHILYKNSLHSNPSLQAEFPGILESS